jgi:hypothetical protein
MLRLRGLHLPWRYLSLYCCPGPFCHAQYLLHQWDSGTYAITGKEQGPHQLPEGETEQEPALSNKKTPCDEPSTEESLRCRYLRAKIRPLEKSSFIPLIVGRFLIDLL